MDGMAGDIRITMNSGMCAHGSPEYHKVRQSVMGNPDNEYRTFDKNMRPTGGKSLVLCGAHFVKHALRTNVAGQPVMAAQIKHKLLNATQPECDARKAFLAERKAKTAAGGTVYAPRKGRHSMLKVRLGSKSPLTQGHIFFAIYFFQKLCEVVEYLLNVDKPDVVFFDKNGHQLEIIPGM